jgi:hypothetical protein
MHDFNGIAVRTVGVDDHFIKTLPVHVLECFNKDFSEE